MKSSRIVGMWVVASTALGSLTVPAGAVGPPATSWVTTAQITQPGDPTRSTSLRRVEFAPATRSEAARTNVAGVVCEIYVDADSYAGNTVKVTFIFLSKPGSQVCFSLHPSCGQISPSCMSPTHVPDQPPNSEYWRVCPDYTPCENPCSNEDGQVTVTADPSIGVNQTKVVCLQERTDICSGQDNAMCVATFDEFGNPRSATVTGSVISAGCGSVYPVSGASQLDPLSGLYIFCSTYTAADYEGRCRARLCITNPAPCVARYGQLLWIAHDQAACCLSPSTNRTPWITSDSRFDPFNERQFASAL